MSQELKTNDDVIAYFRAHGGNVPPPFEAEPSPMVLLHTIGRKTGIDHVTPMRALVEGIAHFVFGTAHGRTTDPDWVRNIVANPMVEIEIGTKRMEMYGSLVGEPDRTRIWNLWSDRTPVLKETARRANRPIPVVRLLPIQ